MVLSREETLQLLSLLSGRELLIAQLLYGCGLRLKEVLRLRVKDIDFDQHQIIVRKNTETQQIDSEVCRQALKLLFDPDFSMVVVLAGNWVIAKQQAAAHYPNKNMANLDLARLEDFGSRYASRNDSPGRRFPGNCDGIS